jgi:hypothetical protein
MSRRSAGRWTTALRAGRLGAPRAGRTLAAALALASIGLPAALLASQAPAAAAAGKRSAQSQVGIAITDMTQQAGPGTTITVKGTVTNSSRQPISNLSVRLLASSMQVSTSTELRPGDTGQEELASTPVPRGTWTSGRELQPGSTDHWSVQVKASSIGMKRFGVYPLTVEAVTTPYGVQLAATNTYLPYVPARKGPYGSSIPPPAKISWVLPLIDKPLLLGPPWQSSCQGSQEQALAASLRSTGRLGQLLAAAEGSAGTANVYSAAARSSRTARGRVVRSEQSQSLSAYDGVTWAVDPALLANVKALAGCGSSRPGWASAASSWLAELRRVTAEPMFFTPYGDPDVAALNSGSHLPDVKTAFALGQSIGQQILGPLTTAGRSSGAQSQAAGIAWPADGIDEATAEALTSVDVRTLLLSSSALPAGQSAVMRVQNNIGGNMKVLLANEQLTRLLATGGSTTGSAFATEQDFLAQTALAAQRGGAPVIVAPPQRWDPAAGLAGDLLAETASAPWLSPASLTSLTAGKHIPVELNYPDTRSATGISKRELRKLKWVDRGISELAKLAVTPNNSLPLALATIESSAWQGRSGRTARTTMLKTVLGKIKKQESSVQILAEPRVTLGGLKGSVPVSIDNRLGYAVKVTLRLHSETAGVKVTPVPDGVVTVPPRTAQTVRLHVQATQVGSTTVTMSLLNQDGDSLPHAKVESMTIEATQVGVLGVIICAAAIGVFLIAYAARAARRAHPAGGVSDPADPGPAPDQGSDHSTEPAEPDTVMAERTELGTAGAHGP